MARRRKIKRGKGRKERQGEAKQRKGGVDIS